MKSLTAVAAIINGTTTDPLLTPKEASEYLGVSQNTLSVWRCVGRYNIPFIKVGRLVKYRKSSLDAFLNHHTHGIEV